MHAHTHSSKRYHYCLYGLYVIQKLVGPGAFCEISSTRERNELRAARKIFLGLKYHVLGLKMVVSDQSLFRARNP